MTVPAAIFIRPILPVPLLALVLLLLAASVWVTVARCALSRRQRVLLWSLRLATMLIMAWLLLLPHQRSRRIEPEPPALLLAIDVSASMDDRPPAASVATRRRRAIEFLTDPRVERAIRRYRVFRYELGADVQESSTPPDELLFNAPRSHLGAGINRIVNRHRADNVAAVLLLTDGLDQSGETLSAHAMTVPMLIPELEDRVTATADERPDTWIADVAYPRTMVVNWSATIDVLVRRTGIGPESFPVNLKQDERLLRSATVQFDGDETFTHVSFSVEPLEVGRTAYRVEIEPTRDAEPSNNRRDLLVDVADPRNRVLYLEGMPRWEFKFFKRALLADRNYQLSSFVYGGDGAFIRFDEAEGMTGGSGGGAPTFSPDELAAYRVVVLGELEASALSAESARNIRDFVDRGGGLLLAGAGRAYGGDGLHRVPALAELFPVEPLAGGRMVEGTFSVDLTSTGRTHPALSALPSDTRLPPLLSFWAPVRVHEFSSVLVATADGSPVLAVRRYGQGRVAVLLTDSLWRWQLGTGAERAERSLHSLFLTQLVHWLAPDRREADDTGGLLQVLTARSEVDVRERVVVGALRPGAGEPQVDELTCSVTTPDGRQLLLPMFPADLEAEVGLHQRARGYKTAFSPQMPGRYELRVANADDTLHASLPVLAKVADGERTGAPLDHEYLAGLAGLSGGRVFPWRERHRLLNEISWKPTDVEIVRERPLWNRWWWIAVLVLLFSVEWWWRRRLDLV